MSDRDVIIRELERDNWLIVEEHGVYTAVHVDGEMPIKFGGRFGWNLRIIRRQASESLGKHTVRGSAKRHKMAKAAEDAKRIEARITHLNERDQIIARENLRRRVITRHNHLRNWDRMMRDPGTTLRTVHAGHSPI